MTLQTIAITLISSLLSGILGIIISTFFYYKLERRKLKIELTKQLLGYRFNTQSNEFSCAMNQVIAVFADSPEVLEKWMKLVESLNASKDQQGAALINFLKAACHNSDLTQSTLSDDYLLKTFNGNG